MKENIKNITLPELKKRIAALGEAPYRAAQVFDWVYRKKVSCFPDMRNLPKSLIEKLEKNYQVESLILSNSMMSKDGTEKFVFKTKDEKFVETVLITSKKRITICISTQIGCKFRCPFCATGIAGFERDLEISEILEQVIFCQKNAGAEITNFVFMGMGEPLDNYDNLYGAIILMNKKEALNIGARRITVSTCGFIPGIERLSDLELQVNLSVSLHAVNDSLRNELVPINKKFPLEKLINSCEHYVEKKGRLITLEYVLIKGKNVSPGDADALAGIAKRLKAKINLIEASPVPGSSFRAPSREEIDVFKKRILNKRVSVTLRVSKGSDIKAACGQLEGKR